jgi:chorismate mutase
LTNDPNDTPAPGPSLDDLRREIDAIDDSLHDLIMRRTAVVERVRGIKGDGVRLRPAREATILRGLIARHEGGFPRAVLLRIWREILGATVRLQGPFSLAVHGGVDDDRRDCRRLARDEYGALTPSTVCSTVGQVFRAVYDGTASVGVLPLPREDDAEPWWPFLAGTDARTPRIVARLPFGGPAGPGGGAAEALAIARLDHAPSGDDRSYIIMETAEAVSRAGLKDELAGDGLESLFLTSWRDGPEDGAWLHLAEVAGFVAPDDARLRPLHGAEGGAGRRAFAVGGYAVPIDAADLREMPAGAVPCPPQPVPAAPATDRRS